MFRRPFTISIVIISSVVMLVVFNVNAIAENKAFLYGGGKVFVLDANNDTIDKKVDLPNEIDKKRVQRMIAFPAAKALIVKDEDKIYAVDIGTMALKNKLEINGEFSEVYLSPDKKNLYIFWQPINMSDYMVESKRKLTIFDESLHGKTVPEIQLGGIVDAIDFSIDGSKLYVIYNGKSGKIQIIDLETKRTLREISFNDFGRETKDTFSKVSLDLKNQKILIVEVDKIKAKYKYLLYVYDMETNSTTKSITIDAGANQQCKLLVLRGQAICDEGVKVQDSIFRRGILHIYDINLGKEIGVVNIASEPDKQNDLLGISLDEKKLYYRTAKGMKVVDLGNLAIIKSVDIPAYSDSMTFYQY